MKYSPPASAFLPALLALATLSTSQPALAYYDPSAQRWLNRDPYDEKGFEIVRRYEGATGPSTANPYSYVVNSPNMYVDPIGLWKFQKCSPSQEADIRKALALTCAAAQKGNCFQCLNSNREKAMDRFCNDKTKGPEETKIVCESLAASKECTNAAGYSYSGSRIIHICFPSPPAAGGLGCAAIHEAAHAVGSVGDDRVPTSSKYDPHAYDIAQCAGCPRPPGF